MVFYARCLRHGKRYIDTRRRCNFGFRDLYTPIAGWNKQKILDIFVKESI